MPAYSPDNVLALLDSEGVVYEYDAHPAVFTTAQSALLERRLPGQSCKNLFLRNKKKSFYALLVSPSEKQTDIAALSDQLQQGRLSFASADDMAALLGVTPGSVTPLALLNDNSARVAFLMDAAFRGDERIVVHPLINTASVSLGVADLLDLLARRDHTVRMLDLPARN